MKGVYFFQVTTGQIKIGWSQNISTRLGHVLWSCPFPVKCIGVIEGAAQRKERELHLQFEEYRVHREWFTPHESLLAYIRENATPFIEVTKPALTDNPDKIIAQIKSQFGIESRIAQIPKFDPFFISACGRVFRVVGEGEIDERHYPGGRMSFGCHNKSNYANIRKLVHEIFGSTSEITDETINNWKVNATRAAERRAKRKAEWEEGRRMLASGVFD